MDALMSESITLLNSQLAFLDTHVALIHIPLQSYHFFIQPILQLLLHHESATGEHSSSRPWTFWHPFCNISVTSNECSIACPRSQAEELFRPVLEKLDASLREGVAIGREDHSVIAIAGEGLEAGQRVLELTSPLATAGISIYFITSYYTDFILVPFSARSRVIRALEQRGFVFEADANGEAGHMMNPSSPLLRTRARSGSSNSSNDLPFTPGTPPPTSITELQIKTFNLLKRNGITPTVDADVELVTCSGIKENSTSSSIANFGAGKLQLGLTKCLTSHQPPIFLSLTMTDMEPASVTLEKRLLSHFHNQGEDLLLGKDGPEQVAITFDLKDLPLESTGIVCGVSSRLTEGMMGRIGREFFNTSYLSTAQAGHVIVYKDELIDALDALNGRQHNLYPDD